MTPTNAQTDTEKLSPNKLEVLRRLSKLCVLALIVPFVAIVLPSVTVAFLNEVDQQIVAALINLSWVLVIFGGFSFLVVSLFSAAVLFRVFNMHDKAHSLGLPRNSIRSLLTFLIFLILLAFIFYSTQVVSTQNSEGIAEIPFELLQQTIASLGISEAVTGYTVGENEAGDVVARVTFLVQEESAAMEYFDRILVALLGISSSIIGFYFGSRSQEALTATMNQSDKVDENTQYVEPSQTAPVDEMDSLDWSIATQKLELSPVEDKFLGVVMINPADSEGDRTFGAQFVPTEAHKTKLDLAGVTVERVADRLTVTVVGVDAETLSQDGLEISIYYSDEEEQAKTLPVTVADP